MKSKYKITILFLLFVFMFHMTSWASHIFGGSVTYEHDANGRYIFQLVLYRDCNGADVSSTAQQLKVWNHPSLSSISLNYVSRTSISPEGTRVPGGPACFDCNTGGSLGIGSIEKVIYRSAPTQISGVPSADGWVFTFDDFSRNGNISNLQNPLNYGITIRAQIFNVGAVNNQGNDNSVQFLQAPHFVTCTGKPFKMNLNPVDPDLDSVRVEWDKPLNYLNNNPYNAASNPLPIPYANGYSFTSPTPGVILSANNQDAQLHIQSGELTFLSYLSGNFVVKIKASSYRGGRLISIVEHELQIIVTNCLAPNNPPIVNGPFGGLWETTVDAGDLVNFTVNSVDNENLQDGSPQKNSIFASGLLFGSNPQFPTDCIIEPCPTVNGPMPISGIQGAQVQINWQTSCDHLLGFDNNELDVVPYQFVFRIQDDFCPIPEVVYYTATINVRNPSIVPATKITCIQGGNADEFTINWEPVNDPNNRFVSYELYTVEQGLMTTINTRTTTSYTTTLTTDLQWYIAVVSGCNSSARRYSDTLRNMYLDLSNTNLGVAALDWNRPIRPARNGMGSVYKIVKEYPVGTWTEVNTTPFNLPQYHDVITVCSEFLSYYIEIEDRACVQRSQISGKIFSDQTPPDIARMTNVSIDTLTGITSVSWDRSPSDDTYGYIVYKTDPVTNWLIEIDTIWGATNTNYQYLEGYDLGPVNYTIAAFDSCPSPTGSPFNLSARDPNLQSTLFLKLTPAICGGNIALDWTSYGGWEVDQYAVYYRVNNSPWQSIDVGVTNSYNYQASAGDDLMFLIEARSANGRKSYSAKRIIDIQPAIVPNYHFIEYATVDYLNKSVKIAYTLDPRVLVSKYELQKEVKGQFETIKTVDNPPSDWEYIDTDVDVNKSSYTYRLYFYDTCGMRSLVSNTARTILLTGQIEQAEIKTYLNWSPYSVFDGSTVRYEVLRRIYSDYSGGEIGSVTALQRSFQDDVYDIETNGLVCYIVRAEEGINRKGEKNFSYSNEVCLEIEPLLYVPNAFIPNGDINTIFKPVFRNVDVYTYQMAIFNRWGQAVFQTNDPTEGWDGNVNRGEEKAGMGTYNYMITFDLGFGEQFVKRGHVTLVR